MNTRHYSSEGVVLARKNYGEADRILVIFSKHFGKLHLLAKGVRKPKSRKRGHIEVFSRLRFSSSVGKGIDCLMEAEILDSYSNVRKDLRKVALAYFLMETIGRLTKEDEKNEDLYDLLISELHYLKSVSKLKIYRLEFIYKVLLLLGYWPQGKKMENPDKALLEATERDMRSFRVGRKILS